MEINFIVIDAQGRVFTFSKECSLSASNVTGYAEYHVFCQNKLIAVFVNPVSVIAEPKLFVENIQEF